MLYIAVFLPQVFLLYLLTVEKSILKSFVFLIMCFLLPALIYTAIFFVEKGFFLFSPSDAFSDKKVVILSVFLSFLIAMAIDQFKKNDNELGSAKLSGFVDCFKRGLFKKDKESVIVGRYRNKPIYVGGNESVLVCSAMGGGKTTSIAIPNIFNWGGSAIINDLKGELWALTRTQREKMGSKCCLFAPGEDIRGANYFNPFYFVNKNRQFWIRDLQRIAEVLMPDDNGHSNSFWVNASRTIFVAIAFDCLEKDSEKLNLKYIYEKSKKSNLLEFLLDLDADGSTEVRQSLSSILMADEKSQSNMLSDFINRLNLYSDPLIQKWTSKNTINLNKLREENHSIYLKLNPSDQDRLKPLMTLFWSTFLNESTRREPLPSELKVLCVLDEFASIGKIPLLKNGMAYLRSYGVRAIIVVQYLDQIRSTYGEKDSEAFLNCKTKLAFSISSNKDAEWFSRLMGQTTKRIKTSSLSSGRKTRNINKQSRYLLTPDEIMRLKKDQLIFFYEGEDPVICKKNYYYK